MKMGQIGMKPVNASLKTDILKDQHERSHSDRQSHQVNEGKAGVISKISKRGSKVAYQHQTLVLTKLLKAIQIYCGRT